MNKTVLITGCSSGIGRATAKYFQFHGWDVIATMRSPEKEKELLKLPNVICPKLDVTKPTTIKSAIKEGIEKFGKIDVIVNNAGYPLYGPFEASTIEQIRQQFEVNVFGCINVIKEMVPYFRKARHGTIINVTSLGGRITFPLFSVYHSTKFALEGLSEAMRYELRPFRVKIKMIEPGAVKTNFYSKSMETVTLKEYNHYMKKVSGLIGVADDFGVPPEHVAKTIFDAANDNSFKQRYIVGILASWLLFSRKYLPDGVYNFIVRSQTEN